MKIKIEAYNPEWARKFKQIQEQLKVHLKAWDPIIEHIGSTAVPGLHSKHVIDIMVGIGNMVNLDKSAAVLSGQNGYVYYKTFDKTIPERRLFVLLKNYKDHKGIAKVYEDFDTVPHDLINRYRLAHIHVWYRGSRDWDRHIAFRDFLREHAEERVLYSQLKIALSQKDWPDGMAYNAAKNELVKGIQSKALVWYSNNTSG